jgi:hypothetical protein
MSTLKAFARESEGFLGWHFALTGKFICGQVLQIRSEKVDASDKLWKLVSLVPKISLALKAYALLATRADKGMVRDASKLED